LQHNRNPEGAGLGRARIPIIALTADVLSDQWERCAKVGMDDFLTKPLDRNCLREVLDRFIGPRSPGEALPRDQAAGG
jgi:CheY-like chemotaxis protein